MTIIANVIGEVVQKVSDKIFTDPEFVLVKQAIQSQLTPGVNAITYLYGHPIEIINTLTLRDQATNELSFKKYPLFAMFQDMAEQPVAGGIEATLQMVIATATKQELRADERYQQTFIPILYPLYELFLQELNKHKKVIGFYKADHQKYDRVYWGTVGDITNGVSANRFNDYLDAIELQNLRISFYKNNC